MKLKESIVGCACCFDGYVWNERYNRYNDGSGECKMGLERKI